MPSASSSDPSGSSSGPSEDPSSVWGIISFCFAISVSLLALIFLVLLVVPAHLWLDVQVGVVQYIRLYLMWFWVFLALVGLLIAAGGIFESQRDQTITVRAARIQGVLLVGLPFVLMGVFLLDPARLSISAAYRTRLPSVELAPTPEHRGRLSPLTDVPKPLRLLTLLEQKRYGELTERIREVQTRYREGTTSDRPVDYVFGSFGSGEVVRRRLNEWVRRRPDSAIPRIARAYHHAWVGNLARGAAWAQNTPDEYFQRMATHHDTAVRDLKKALNLDPRATVAYAKLIDLGMNHSFNEKIVKIARKGLNQDPASWELRQDYLEALQPKWGGSFQAIKDFTGDCLKHADRNPELKALTGYLAFVKSQDPRYFDKAADQKQLLTRAIKFGNVPRFLNERAELFHEHGYSGLAMEDVTRALMILPQMPRYLKTRAEIHRDRGDTQQALQDLNLAVKLDSMNYRVLSERAEILMEREEYRKAVRDLEDAVVYEPREASRWSLMGYLRLRNLEEYERAQKDFERAIELEPNEESHRYYLVLSLKEQEDCKITDAIRNYLELCEREGECQSKHKELILKGRRKLKEKGKCY